MQDLRIKKSVTTREYRSVESFLKDLSKERRITPEEEVELALRISKGDQGALDALVCSNLRFVVSVAKQYQGHGIPLPDLISVGSIGLIIAARRFNPSRGFTFCTYAVWWIRQSLQQAISREGNVVSLPANQAVQLNRARKKSLELEQELERQPTREELDEAMGNAKVPTDLLSSGAKYNTSFDTPVGEDNTATMADFLVDDEAKDPDQGMVVETQNRLLCEALGRLCPSDREAVSLHYGIGCDHAYTIHEISMRMGVSCERVRQLVRHGLECLRKGPFRNQLMAEAS